MIDRKFYRRRGRDLNLGSTEDSEEAFRDSGVGQGRMRAMIESTAIGIIITDYRGIVLDSNPAAELIHGRTKSSVLGTCINEYISPAPFRRGSGGILDSLYSSNRIVAGEWRQARVLAHNGKTTPVELAVSRADTREGLMVTFFIRDITEALTARMELRNATRRAEKATEAKSRYLATMSHEIRTPLNAILGSLDLLAESTLTSEQQRLLEAARLSGRAVKNLTDDIIDLSKIESGHLELNSNPFDLMMLVDDTAHSIAPGAYAKGLEICLLIDANVPRYLLGDIRRLQQILLNLLTNAIKFTRNGAVILHVTASADHRDKIAVRFSIVDTGIGIPDSMQGRLFQEFFRGDDSRSNMYKGSGLGLAISKTLVSAMGGTVGVDSEDGKGSQFWFCVKLREDPDSPRFENELARRVSRHSVIVQRNSLSAETMRRQLEGWGDNVLVMPSLMQALNYIAEQKTKGNKVSTVYLDAELAEMYAKETTATNTDFLDLDLAILVKPGSTKSESLRKRLHPSVYLAKPIRSSDLWMYHVEREDFKRHQGRNNTGDTLKGLKQLSETATTDIARILLAEDSEVNQMVVKAMLESENHIVDVVSNGIEAVVAATTSFYDLIIMDLTMPEKGGVEAAVEIRQQLTSECPPIIAMTGNVFDEDRKRCLRAGMTAFMIKPVDKRQLLSNVTLALKRPPHAEPVDNQASNSGSASSTQKDSQQLISIDSRVLKTLREQIGESNAQTAMTQFVFDARELVTQIIGHKGDVTTRKRAAHTLKSVAATFGVNTVQSIAAELEQALDIGNPSRVAVLTSELEKVSQMALKEFRTRYLTTQVKGDRASLVPLMDAK